MSKMKPLSCEQFAIWKRLRVGRGTHNITVSARLFGLVDKDALAAAVRDVIDRHDILRTIFPESDGIARQEILDVAAAPELSMQEIDALHKARVVKAAADYRFDLTRETPMRAHLFSSGENEHTLLFVFHRIAFDSRSVDPLMRDLFAFYSARIEKREPNLPPLPMQYADYARMQSINADNAAGANNAACTGNEDDGEDIETSGIIPIRINPGMHGGLIAFAKESGVSIDSILYTGLSVVFSRHGFSDSTTISAIRYAGVNTATDGGVACYAQMIGNFETVLSFEVDTQGNPTFREAINRAVKAVATVVKNPSRHFRALFRLRPASVETFDFPNLKVFVNPVSMKETGFEMIFDLSEHLSGDGKPQGIEGNVNFSSNIFTAGQMATRLDGMMTLLKRGILNPDAHIDEISTEDAPTKWECAALSAESRAKAPEHIPMARVAVVRGDKGQEKIPLGAAAQSSAVTASPGWQQSYVSFQDVLQCRLSGIWEETLNIACVGARDRFVDLGGDEDKADRLIAAINEVFRKDFPVSLMCGGATVESLSRAIFRELPFEAVSEVQSRMPDSKPPLFFVHGDVFGGGFYTIELARHLGVDRPFFSFNPHGLNGFDCFESIEKMATDNLNILRQICDDGRFYLGGYCTGAFIAYEMARIMEREGRRIEYPLLLVEVPAGDISETLPQSVVGREPRPAKQSAAPRDFQLRKAWVLNEMFRLSGSHRLGRYNGTVVVFQPEKSLSDEALVRAVWKNAAADIQFRSIPGDHITCIGRHVPELAGILREVMDVPPRGGSD